MKGKKTEIIEAINKIFQEFEFVRTELFVQYKCTKYFDIQEKYISDTESFMESLKCISDVKNELELWIITILENKILASDDYIFELVKRFEDELISLTTLLEKKNLINDLRKRINRLKNEKKLDLEVGKLSLENLQSVSSTKILYIILLKLEYEKKLESEDIEKFTNIKWCKDNFGTKYALLKVENENDENAYIINGERCYFRESLFIGPRKYYIFCKGSNRTKKILLEYYQYKMGLITIDDYMEKINPSKVVEEVYELENEESKNQTEEEFEILPEDIFDNPVDLLNWLGKDDI